MGSTGIVEHWRVLLVFAHVCSDMFLCVPVCVCVCVCGYVYTCICISVCICEHMCVYKRECVCECVCVYETERDWNDFINSCVPVKYKNGKRSSVSKCSSCL